MQDIIELVTFISAKKPSASEYVDPTNGLEASNLYARFYQYVVQGKFTDDETASLILYNTKPSDKKYLMLKNRLRDRLVNSLLLINKKKVSGDAYNQAIHVSTKYCYAATMMAAAGARESALTLARSALSLAQKFQLFDILVQCSSLLRSLHAYAGNQSEFLKMTKLCNYALQEFENETKAKQYVEQLYVRLARTKSHDEALAHQAHQFLLRIKALLRRSPTFPLQDAYFRIGVIYYQLIKDYQKLLQHIDRFERYLLQHPHLYLQAQRGKFALLKITAYLYLRNFEQGKKEAEHALQLFRRGTNNWFTTLENYFLLCMQAGAFAQAEQLFDLATRHERFGVLPEVKIETWRVYEAYLMYALPNRRLQKTFRIQKFLNEVPIFQKDKAGLYPAILIAQVLFLFEMMDEQRLEKILENLRVYATRNLRRVSARRTMEFIKIMRLLFNYHYDLKKALSKIEAPLARMKEALKTTHEELDTLEIVAYEILVDRIVERLKGINPQRLTN